MKRAMIAGLCALALAGCAGGAGPATTPTPTPTASATRTPTPTPSPTKAKLTTVDVCNEVKAMASRSGLQASASENRAAAADVGNLVEQAPAETERALTNLQAALLKFSTALPGMEMIEASTAQLEAAEQLSKLCVAAGAPGWS